ncbi:Omp28-related outer membrane protein [Prevotella intermedia]|uniref:Omp28-related outer membrane protein n=1 Tax=Prevotella intermedia TaxID=28131 RepID=UPI000BE72B2D|nr:Omp28-related outer membrane protein [Prevotella intermedia]PDP82074.1 secretion protein [Prevotella intermedia]
MKKILFLFSLLLCLISIETKAAPTHCYWGYCNSKVTGEFGSKTKAKGAIYIPAEVAKLYKGKTISVIKVGLAAMSENIKVFITKDLNGENLITKTAGNLYNGWNEVKLSSTYTIDGEGFYIGYSYEGNNKSMGHSAMYSPNGCWADLGDGWKNYATDSKYNALALTLQAQIAGEDMPKDLWLYTKRNVIVKKNASCKFNFGVINLSPRIARTLQVGYTIDDAEEKTAEFKTTMGANVEKEFSIDYSGFSKNGVHTVKFRLISVDGEADAYAGNNSDYTNVKVMDAIPQQRFVVEEGTGTWCGWCPRGIVAFRHMAEKYPETFIGIAVHKNDALATNSYSKLEFKGYPTCYVNRNLKNPTSPEAGTLEVMHNKYVATPPHIGVEVKADFTDDTKKKINAKALTTFFADEQNVNYKVSFVLIENGIKGYKQANYYAGGKSGKMGGFENLPGSVAIDMDHVARMNYSFYGVEGSIPTSVKADETVEYAAQLDVPKNIQNADNLYLIALLINSKGEIENAAEAKVMVDPSMSITDNRTLLVPEFTFANGTLNVNGFSGKVFIYNVYGVEVPNQSIPSGIYIIKCVDGNKSFVKKMILK